MKRTTGTIAAAAILLAAFATPSLAQTSANTNNTGKLNQHDQGGQHDKGSQHDQDDDAPGAGWMSAADITTRLNTQGYQIRSISAEDGQWEVDATDKSNNRVELRLDPKTGEIVNTSAKH